MHFLSNFRSMNISKVLVHGFTKTDTNKKNLLYQVKLD